VILGVAARLAAPSIVRSYVIRTLEQDPVYAGQIGDVTLHVWRGAYSIEGVKISKRTAQVPVHFFYADRVDLSIEWSALFAGELVGLVTMERPELNFVDDKDPSRSQSGAGAPWLQMVRDLFPFRIDRCDVREGSVHFRAFRTEPPVDVYLTKVEGSVTDLTNIHEDVTPLFATVKASAVAMDQAAVDFDMRLDPQAYRPTFQLAVSLVGLDVVKLNALAKSYGRFDFEQGKFDLVVELDAKDGRVEGYVKPLFRDVRVFDVIGDLKEGDVLHWFWQALVGAASFVFKNQPRDQIATVVPLSGDLSGVHPDILALIGNILRNAFIRAYLPRLEGTTPLGADITFGPGKPPGVEK